MKTTAVKTFFADEGQRAFVFDGFCMVERLKYAISTIS